MKVKHVKAWGGVSCAQRRVEGRGGTSVWGG